MKVLTIRNVSSRLAAALEREKRRRGTSLNAVVLDVLSEGLGLNGRGRRSNGLARLAGTWTEEESRSFDAAVRVTEHVDDEMWR